MGKDKENGMETQEDEEVEAANAKPKNEIK